MLSRSPKGTTFSSLYPTLQLKKGIISFCSYSAFINTISVLVVQRITYGSTMVTHYILKILSDIQDTLMVAFVIANLVIFSIPY